MGKRKIKYDPNTPKACPEPVQLGLNIHVYSEHIESYLEQAKLYLRKGEAALAEASLLKALSIKPDNTAVAELLEKVCQH